MTRITLHKCHFGDDMWDPVNDNQTRSGWFKVRHADIAAIRWTRDRSRLWRVVGAVTVCLCAVAAFWFVGR